MADRSKTLGTNEISLRLLGVVVAARGIVGIGAVLLIALLALSARYTGLI